MVTKIKRRGFSLRSLCMRLGALFILVLLPLQANSVQAGTHAAASQNAPKAPADPPQPPVAVDDSFSAFARRPFITANVLSNDSDPLLSSLFIKSIDIQGTKGMVTLLNPWQDSSLDLSFGTGGKVSTAIGGYNEIESIVIQPDNKIIAAGTIEDKMGYYTFGLARYNPDGSLDTSFNGSGTATVPYFSGNSQLWSMLLQPDGKIVVAGSVYPDFGIARFNPDGSLDSSFSGDGRVTINFADPYAAANSIARQTDGKLLVAGRVNNDAYENFGLARLNPNGSLDTSFSGDGKLTTDFGGDDSGYTVLLQSNGKIVVVGRCTSSEEIYDYHIAIARYNSNGSLDTSFGSGGKVTTKFAYPLSIDHAIMQPDGKILVTGTDLDNKRIVLTRYNTNGSVDTSFGTNGITLTDLGKEPWVANLALQPDGKILVAGSIFNLGVGDFLLLRYTTDGSLDTGFGSGGKVTIDFSGGWDAGDALALQQDGKTIVGGIGNYIGNGNFSNFALARVNQDGLYQVRNSFRYDPNGQFDALLPGEKATDTFSYVVSNGVLTDTATVSITVGGADETFLPLLEK